MLVLTWLACSGELDTADSATPATDDTATPVDTDPPRPEDTGGFDWEASNISEGLASWQAFLEAVEDADTEAAAEAWTDLEPLVAEADGAAGTTHAVEAAALLELAREAALSPAAWALRAAWVAWARALVEATPSATDPVAELARVRELVAALGATVAEADGTWNEDVSGELDEALTIARRGAERADGAELAAGLARLDGSLDLLLHRRVIGALAGFEDADALGAWTVLAPRVEVDELDPWGAVQLDEWLRGPRDDLDQAAAWSELDEGFVRRALQASAQASDVGAVAAARQAWLVTSVGAASRTGEDTDAERSAWDAVVLTVYVGSDASAALADREAALCAHLDVLAGTCASTEALPDAGLGSLADPSWSWDDPDASDAWQSAWTTLQALDDTAAAWAAWAELAPLANAALSVDLSEAFAELARAETAGLDDTAALARAAILAGAELGVLEACYSLDGPNADAAASLVDAPASLDEARDAWLERALAGLPDTADAIGVQVLELARLRAAWAAGETEAALWAHGLAAARRGDAGELGWAVEALQESLGGG